MTYIRTVADDAWRHFHGIGRDTIKGQLTNLRVLLFTL